MGVNLVTRVRNFYIQQQTFSSADHDVEDGCITPGTHRVLRFDFLSFNAGDSDFVIGSPAARPDLFVWSSAHGHYHIKDFNQFLLFDAAGHLATIGYKQAFCAVDIEKIRPSAGPARFDDCNANQGISSGWADVYGSGLACQYIVIDGLPDGDYTLQSTTNSPHVAAEECFGDNTTWTGLRITGNAVSEVAPPWLPEDRLTINPSNVAAVQIAGRWKVVDGDHWMIDTGTNQSAADRAVEIIKHYGLSYMCFVGRPRCGDVEPMMYFLNGAGHAPSGSLPGEDEIAFDPAALQVQEVGERWKVVEGAHWLLDFGVGEANARAALYFILEYRFNRICFVGRPHPPMTYFKSGDVAGFRRIHQIDTRLIDLALDPPAWHHQHAELVARHTVSADFSSLCAEGEERHRGVKVTVSGTEGREPSRHRIRTRYGVTGLDCGLETVVELLSPATILDFEVAHFGVPPTIRVLDDDGRTVAELEPDPRPRQVERLRAVGKSIRRAVFDTKGGETLLVAVSAPSVGTLLKKKG
jgi:Lysyl oxidase